MQSYIRFLDLKKAKHPDLYEKYEDYIREYNAMCKTEITPKEIAADRVSVAQLMAETGKNGYKSLDGASRSVSPIVATCFLYVPSLTIPQARTKKLRGLTFMQPHYEPYQQD